MDPGLADLLEVTIAELQARMAAGTLSARELVQRYRARIEVIDRRGPAINAVLELNPDAEEIAAALDRERRKHGPRRPLHGIPLLLKDNIDILDRMHTTAGSLALDATVVACLRAAGVVLPGKLNLSAWANFRSTSSSSGWREWGGSSSGSGTALGPRPTAQSYARRAPTWLSRSSQPSGLPRAPG
jgi:amidase